MESPAKHLRGLLVLVLAFHLNGCERDRKPRLLHITLFNEIAETIDISVTIEGETVVAFKLANGAGMRRSIELAETHFEGSADVTITLSDGTMLKEHKGFIDYDENTLSYGVRMIDGRPQIVGFEAK